GGPRGMDQAEGRPREELDDEVPIAHRVDRVRGYAVESGLASRRLPVERIAGAGQSTRPERRDVRPSAGIRQPTPVALEHLDVREEMVREQDRLCRLEVRRTRHDGLAVPLGEPNEGAL